MNLKRAATIGVVGGVLAVWLAAVATSRRHEAPAPPVARRTPVDTRSAALADQIAQLHDHPHPTASPQQPGRNLFQFRAPKVKAPAVAPHAALTEAALANVPPPPPALKLSGVAQDPGQDGPVRTAVISGVGQLFLVKEGEMVTPRYRVSRISDDVVELIDVGTSEPLRIAMRP
jgi:hypothetical protein